ncbi:hypothetical protein BDN70DRAFT_901871 [Pholiota conissans]|uniref:Uncharacterized protein n=1 Tax=Pholiota conissans TaxID=109636 RepID=A0A9P5YJ15_9AGAR|nr:hypothetical protein BDN70DRAFT_901871 [Pholiota conissans]
MSGSGLNALLVTILHKIGTYGWQKTPDESVEDTASEHALEGNIIKLIVSPTLPKAAQEKLLVSARTVKITANWVERLNSYSLIGEYQGPARILKVTAYLCHNPNNLECERVTDTSGNMNRHQFTDGHGRETKSCPRCGAVFRNGRSDPIKRHQISGACDRKARRRAEAEAYRRIEVKRAIKSAKKGIVKAER